MNKITLSKADLQIINEVFCQAYCFDLPEKWDDEKETDDDNFTSERFSQVWDLISQEVSK
tara:strand:+ start:219 stop:398 length:180 start_codon:yes stop_codon:yes gene_type:complete